MNISDVLSRYEMQPSDLFEFIPHTRKYYEESFDIDLPGNWAGVWTVEPQIPVGHVLFVEAIILACESPVTAMGLCINRNGSKTVGGSIRFGWGNLRFTDSRQAEVSYPNPRILRAGDWLTFENRDATGVTPKTWSTTLIGRLVMMERGLWPHSDARLEGGARSGPGRIGSVGPADDWNTGDDSNAMPGASVHIGIQEDDRKTWHPVRAGDEGNVTA